MVIPTGSTVRSSFALGAVVDLLAGGRYSASLATALGDGAFVDGGGIDRILSIKGQNAVVFPFELHESKERKMLRIARHAPMTRSDLFRYRAIVDFVNANGTTIGLPTIVVVDNIVDEGIPTPGLVLADVKGDALDSYLETSYTDKDALILLARRFRDRILSLQALGFGHGDLSHDNVMVRANGGKPEPIFVDFDGAFLHGVPVHKSLGHPFFQHPGRAADDWGPWMDSVSALLIWTSLRAIAFDTSLYESFGAAGNILFTEGDLRKPRQTNLWKQLEGNDNVLVRRAVQTLADLLDNPYAPRMSFASLLPVTGSGPRSK